MAGGVRLLGGKCYCGAVQYRVADEFLYAANCHCSNCRRTTGSAFKPFGSPHSANARIRPSRACVTWSLSIGRPYTGT